MEREKFEDSWKEAFEKAEISPSDTVWTNIELDLEKTKGGQLKKRLMFYQMLAAASVVFAMAIGSVGFFYGFQHQYSINNLSLKNTVESKKSTADLRPSPTTETQSKAPITASPSKKYEDPKDSDQVAVLPNETSDIDQAEFQKKRSADPDNKISEPVVSSGSKIENSLSKQNKKSVSDTRGFTSPDQISGIKESADGIKNLAELPTAIEDKNLSAFYEPKSIELKIPEKEIDPVIAMLARLEMREKEVSGEKKNKKSEETENLWTSVGFAAGPYNTVNSGVDAAAPASTMMASSQIADQEAKASGVSYSMGVNIGTKLAERWVFQGGVNYLTHSSDYTADNAVVSQNFQSFRPASTNELLKSDQQDVNEKIIYTAPYNINNSLRYLSIPMQAGYLLINKTFGLQINAGVATDLFLQNTVKADGDKVGGKIDNTTQSSGADSPYRSVNLSGLLGTEFSYRFGQHYRIALNPGIRYPFNTIYKSNLGVQASPFTFDVGLRFRYIFH